MTLERRPQLTHEQVEGIEPRSSMTLPGDGRLRRYLFYYFNFMLLSNVPIIFIFHRPHVTNMKDKHRDEWFKETTLKEDSISDDDQP